VGSRADSGANMTPIGMLTSVQIMIVQVTFVLLLSTQQMVQVHMDDMAASVVAPYAIKRRD
jgi:hypothetical protein